MPPHYDAINKINKDATKASLLFYFKIFLTKRRALRP